MIGDLIQQLLDEIATLAEQNSELAKAEERLMENDGREAMRAWQEARRG